MLRTPASTWRSGSIRCEEARAGTEDCPAWAKAFCVDANSIATTPDMAVPSRRRRCRSINRGMANPGAWSENSRSRQFKCDTIMFLSDTFGVANPQDYRHDGRDILRYSIIPVV